MSKNTPGPWFTSMPNEGGGTLIKPIPGQVIARCDELPEMVANAHLIAAAPELLEALLRCKFDSLNMSLDDVAFCRAAIAKARGEA